MHVLLLPASLHRDGSFAFDKAGEAAEEPLPCSVYPMRNLDEVRHEKAIGGRVLQHAARGLLPGPSLLLGPPDEDLHRRHVRLPLPLPPGPGYVGVRELFFLWLPAAVQPLCPCPERTQMPHQRFSSPTHDSPSQKPSRWHFIEHVVLSADAPPVRSRAKGRPKPGSYGSLQRDGFSLGMARVASAPTGRGAVVRAVRGTDAHANRRRFDEQRTGARWTTREGGWRVLEFRSPAGLLRAATGGGVYCAGVRRAAW